MEVYPSPDATALGVAALARLGTSAVRDPHDAIGRWTPAAVFEPRIAPSEAEARLDGWRRVAEAAVALAPDPP